MISKIFVFAVLGVLFLLPPTADARVGGGRSFGSRGSRSVSPHYVPSQPRREAGQGDQNSPYRSVPNPSPFDPRSGSYGGTGGGFFRGLAGGLAGGFLGSMLFRGLGGG